MDKIKSAAYLLRCAALTLLVSLLFASCASKAAMRQSELAKSLGRDDFTSTINQVKKGKKKLYGKNNAFLYYMDLGLLYHYAGRYDSSNVYLQKAVRVYDDLFTWSVTDETAAIMTNDNVKPYKAKPYELAFMHQIAALNFMATGNFESALVETRKMQLHFYEWERTRAKDKKYHSDGMFHLLSSLAYERAGEIDNSLISLFKAVKAYQAGPIGLPPVVRGFAYDRFNANGREKDAELLGLTPYEGRHGWTAKMGDTEIIVIGYAGKGPYLAEQTWSGTYISGGLLILRSYEIGDDLKHDVLSIPAPILPVNPNAISGGSTFHLEIALPKARTRDSKTGGFSADIGGTRYGSVMINNLDDQLKKYMDDEINNIMARTAVRVLVRTITAQATKSALRKAIDDDGSILNLLTSIMVDVGASVLEQADTRLSFALPKTVHITRIPVKPGTHTVTLNIHNQQGAVIGQEVFQDVRVRRGDKKLLLVNSLR